MFFHSSNFCFYLNLKMEKIGLLYFQVVSLLFRFQIVNVFSLHIFVLFSLINH